MVGIVFYYCVVEVFVGECIDVVVGGVEFVVEEWVLDVLW